jgi:hypothetical protein
MRRSQELKESKAKKIQKKIKIKIKIKKNKKT